MTNTPGEANDPAAVLEHGQEELHKFWWLYLPILFYIFRYVGHFIGDHTQGLSSYFEHELGIVETGTVVILFVALICTLSMLIRFGRSLGFLFKLFLVLYCLGCIYFAGEEASWGQHWFGWASTDFFNTHNDQGETNFHNTTHLLDRTPKGIISALIFIGGVLIPLWLAYKQVQISYSAKFWWIWPTWICLPTAIITTISTLPAKVEHWSGLEFYFSQAQEMKECYIAYFILLYILSLGKRLAHIHEQDTELAAL